MENEQELKAKFFAQHYGQPCRRNKTIGELQLPSDHVTGAVVESISYGHYPDAYLELREVSQLTDEECLEICKFYDNQCKWELKESGEWMMFESPVEKIWVFKDESEPIFSVEDNNGSCTNYGIGEAYQYLLRIGILLPFTYLESGKPVTLTPTDLIKKGWAKIKKRKLMKVKWDDRKILLTKPFIEAIKNLMREEILMFRVREPENRECWVIGVCEIQDLMNANGMRFTFGGIEDAPCMIKDAEIWVEVPL